MTAASKPIRRNDLDFARIVAIIAVIIIHCLVGVIITQPVGSKAWMAGNAIDSFARWSVPVFIMISGSLLIKPSTFKKTDEFFKKRFSRLLIPILVWPLLYIIWGYFAYGTPISIQDLALGYLVGVPGRAHLFFLFLIAGLYVLAPLISMYAEQTSKKQFRLATIIVLVATVIWWGIDSTMPHHDPSLNIITQGLPYIGYFMAGYVLKDVTTKRLAIPVSIFVASCLIITILSFFTAQRYGTTSIYGLFFYGYPTIFVMIASLAAFISFRGLYFKLADKIPAYLFSNHVNLLAKLTFGVYLIHVMILEGFIQIAGISSTSLKSSLLLVFITTISAFGISLIMIRIPYINRLIQ